MNSKWIIFTGILLLTAGIALKITNNATALPLILILTGVAFKVAYIIIKIITKEYQPGYEFIFLGVGLALFLSGIFLHKAALIENPTLLKISGISLKVIFILLFIRKSKTQSKQISHEK